MRRVLLVAFQGAQTLDVTGPAEVFAAASRQAGRVYGVAAASVGGGTIETSSGLRLETLDLRRIRPERLDTVIVAGGDEAAVIAAMKEPALLAWLVRARGRSRRLASVCSGAFVLAAAGLLDGKRATTHWSSLDRLASYRSTIDVDRSSIFVRDGTLWTSAGVTTGIDMALAMVEDDVGRAVADAVAARLVLYVRRPGFQGQFSEALVAQAAASNPLGEVIAWARAHLERADPDALAARAGVSLRTFHRRCLEHLETTPAKLLEKLRVDHARTLLSTTSLPTKALAKACGFGSPAHLEQAFRRVLGLGTRPYRLLFRSPVSARRAAPSRRR
jgi:transcriptional regulator GlxA family with amidase domain